MKNLGATMVLLVTLALLCSSVSVQAQQGAISVAYVSLITLPDSTDSLIPTEGGIRFREMVERNARPVLWFLGQAQSAREILRFRYDRPAGLIEVAYRGSKPEVLVEVNALDDLDVYRRQFAEAMRVHFPRPAAALPRWSVSLHSSYWGGSNLGVGTTVKATLRAPGGKLLASGTATANSSGYAWGFFDSGPFSFLEWTCPGCEVTFETFTGTTPIGTYVFDVPNLTYTAWNGAYIIDGLGPPSSSVEVYLNHPMLNPGEDWHSWHLIPTTDAAGSWTADFSVQATEAFRNGDYLGVYATEYTSTSTFETAADFSLPSYLCYLGDNNCWGSGVPFQDVTFKVKRKGGTEKAVWRGTRDMRGNAETLLYDRDTGSPVFVMPKTHVINGSDVPRERTPSNITVKLKPAKDLMRGMAPANTCFHAVLYVPVSGGGYNYHYKWACANGAGTYSLDFGVSGVDIIPGSIAWADWPSPTTGHIFSAFGMTQ